jgi:hypothetical protein
MKLLHGAVVATALALAAGDAQAAAASCQALQKKDPNIVCRLGAHVPSRFYRPKGVRASKPSLGTPAALVSMLESEKGRIIALLQVAPLPRPVTSAADAQALYDAMLAAAKAQPAPLIRIGGPGGHSAEFPFMALTDWKTGKDRLKVPQGGATAIKWGGDPKGFEAFEVPFKWDGWDWRLYVPFACGNFWLEAEKVELVKPTVSVSSGDVCLAQPVPLAVKVTDAVKVELTVDGQTRALDPNNLPSTLGALGLGDHQVSVTATSKDGLSATDGKKFVVRSCPPTCDALSVTPARIRLRNTVEVAARASVNPAYGSSQSIRQIVVTVNGPAGTQMSFDGGSGSKNWKPEAIGDYTITAVATDSLGQQSAACPAATLRVDRPAVVPFGAAFLGKERLEQEYENDAGRMLATGVCSAIFGAKGGALFALGETGDFELAAGVKVNLEEGDRGEATSIFVDAAAQRLLGRGFIGGGLSAWDLTESDTRSIGALIQGGIDLDSKGKFQFTVEGRLPFNKLDDVDNNYQFWGGIRIRPAQR